MFNFPFAQSQISNSPLALALKRLTNPMRNMGPFDQSPPAPWNGGIQMGAPLTPDQQEGMSLRNRAKFVQSGMQPSNTIGDGLGNLARGFVANRLNDQAADKLKGFNPQGQQGFGLTPFGQTPLGTGIKKLFGG